MAVMNFAKAKSKICLFSPENKRSFFTNDHRFMQILRRTHYHSVIHVYSEKYVISRLFEQDVGYDYGVDKNRTKWRQTQLWRRQEWTGRCNHIAPWEDALLVKDVTTLRICRLRPPWLVSAPQWRHRSYMSRLWRAAVVCFQLLHAAITLLRVLFVRLSANFLGSKPSRAFKFKI